MFMRKRKQQQISHAELLRVLHYEQDTGWFIWMEKVGKSIPGTVAGYEHSRGYRALWIAGVQYLAHRLAVFYMTGVWPAEDVDHINGDRSDNRWRNLRTASRSVNMQNQRRARSDNTTGFLGVVPNRARFSAQIRVNGVTKCLGTFDTPEEAHASYMAAKIVMHPGHATAAARGVDVYAAEKPA